MRTGVVGHLEWVEFLRVDSMPGSGDIVHAQEWWEEPGGGGPGAAVQLSKLADHCSFFTALGDDRRGRRSHDELSAMGVTVHASWRAEPTRRAVTFVDKSGERTITVLGDRLHPGGDEPLPWDELQDTDAVYFTAGDTQALRHARRAGALVATSRVVPVLARAGVVLDALVGSALDPSEIYREGDIDPAPRLVVRTEGSKGGSFQVAGEPQRRFEAPALTRPIVDRYGAGDSFAAGLTYALGRGMSAGAAIELAARCGAAVLAGRGPYEGQLTRAHLERP